MKHKYLLLNLLVLVFLFSCKKDAPTPGGVPTIIGKWFLTRQNSLLFNGSNQIAAFNNTAFTPNDFVEYYTDGSGYFSTNTATTPNLKEFHYTLNGVNLIQFNGANTTGIPETITKLTTDSLSIHAQYQIADPNNPNVTDTEQDDFAYSRAN